ncbi:PAS domain S-box protein [Conexibacter sp. S30A1]|uniref:GGDEF domain-containing response regulator n=1 Tax=Conexibacter sp. S30A1 TaxID=2937800 RepID=UPI00200E22A5|nr:PAS domain S-box protein [Conexibacter sp. S30A1]
MSDNDIGVLLATPAEEVAVHLRAVLEQVKQVSATNVTVSVVGSAGAAVASLHRAPSQVTIVDIGDGSQSGLEALRLVASSAHATAIIALTSSAEDAVAQAAFACGAQECLLVGTTDLEPARLGRSLRAALARSAHDSSRPLATLIDLSSDAIITISRSLLVTRFNAAAERLFRRAASEIIGRPVGLLLPAGERQERIALFERVLQGETIEAHETVYTMRDGRRVIMSASGSPVLDASGEVVETCLIIRDVTEAVTARLRLTEQQRLLESSQAAGRIGSWAADRLTGRMDWSAEHYRLLRRDPARGPARIVELIDLFHPDDREMVLSCFHRDASFVCEARFIADPQDVRIFRLRAEFVPREDGQPGRLLGITQDVTEERAEQAARAQAEEQLRRAFDEALIGMSIADLNGRPLRVNRALCEIFGMSEQELLATTFGELTHPDDREGDVLVAEALLSGSQRHHVREKRYRHADGHTIWAELGLSLITDSAGRPLHFIGQLQDVTERRARLEELRELADHDPLTGLLNRRAFGRELEGHLTRCQRRGLSGALLMFDLDDFKQHNDTLGHGAGDELLAAVAVAVRARLRASDVTGRLGGDEFAVLLPDADQGTALLVAESLLAQIGAAAQAAGAGSLSASIGLVCLERLTAPTPDAVLRAADQALYAAKRAGRNRLAQWQADVAGRAGLTDTAG